MDTPDYVRPLTPSAASVASFARPAPSPIGQPIRRPAALSASDDITSAGNRNGGINGASGGISLNGSNGNIGKSPYFHLQSDMLDDGNDFAPPSLGPVGGEMLSAKERK
jgi:hypothetical protein